MSIRKISNNEEGFVLVVALIVVVILSLIGVAGLNTSRFEVQIAGNDWNAKRSFYRADGGISTGYELLEQNFNCPTGFKGTGIIENTVVVDDMTLAANFKIDSDLLTGMFDDPTANYHAAYPSATKDGLPAQDVGYLYFGGNTSLVPGGSLQMAAGYEGKGKSAAQGGVAKLFNVYSQFIGPKNSEAIIVSGWRHMVGTEGDCNY